MHIDISIQSVNIEEVGADKNLSFSTSAAALFIGFGGSVKGTETAR